MSLIYFITYYELDLIVKFSWENIINLLTYSYVKHFVLSRLNNEFILEIATNLQRKLNIKISRFGNAEFLYLNLNISLIFIPKKMRVFTFYFYIMFYFNLVRILFQINKEELYVENRIFSVIVKFLYVCWIFYWFELFK